MRRARLSIIDGLRQRLYRRRAARLTGANRLAAIGSRSLVNPPALIVGHSFIRIGEQTHIHPRAFLSVVQHSPDAPHEPRLAIGDRVQIGFDFVVACAGEVVIEDDVLIADRVFVGDTSHGYRDVNRPVRHQPLNEPRPVRIGRGAFLGIGCVVLPGVTVGENGYVGAGAVVTRDVPAHSVVAGNPARVVRRWNGEAWLDG